VWNFKTDNSGTITNWKQYTGSSVLDLTLRRWSS